MTQQIIRYACEFCHVEYNTLKEAEECESEGEQPAEYDAQVGDIVSCGYYGWWNGDPNWVSGKEGDFFHDKEMVHPFFIVVARLPACLYRRPGDDGHNVHYWLWTPSYCEGNPHFAWTSRHHTGMKFRRKATDDELSQAASWLLARAEEEIGFNKWPYLL